MLLPIDSTINALKVVNEIVWQHIWTRPRKNHCIYKPYFAGLYHSYRRIQIPFACSPAFVDQTASAISSTASAYLCKNKYLKLYQINKYKKHVNFFTVERTKKDKYHTQQIGQTISCTW